MSRPLVVTITPNPSVDLLFEAERLVWDDANRIPMPRRRVGGQGINLVRALRVLGGAGEAIALLGGPAGAELRAMLGDEGLPLLPVPAEADTRVFVAARERATGHSLLLNPRGPHSSERSAAALLEAAEHALRTRRPAWLACCGSVPPGMPDDTYARLGALAHAHGARFVADCDGELLRRAVAAGCDLLVPNRHEAERLTGTAIGSVADAADAARGLRALGADVACITLGEEGAVAAAATGAWHAATPAEKGGSAVGAGDAFLAALLLALGPDTPLPRALADATAAGAAVLKSEGGDLLTIEEYRRQLERVELRALG